MRKVKHGEQEVFYFLEVVRKEGRISFQKFSTKIEFHTNLFAIES